MSIDIVIKNYVKNSLKYDIKPSNVMSFAKYIGRFLKQYKYPIFIRIFVTCKNNIDYKKHRGKEIEVIDLWGSVMHEFSVVSEIVKTAIRETKKGAKL